MTYTLTPDQWAELAPPGMFLTLTEPEHRALAWIAARYTSAAELYDGPRWANVPAHAPDQHGGVDLGEVIRVHLARISPDTAARYVAALPDDWSTGTRYPLPDTAPPCAAGTLAEKCRQVAAYAARYAADHGA